MYIEIGSTKLHQQLYLRMFLTILIWNIIGSQDGGFYSGGSESVGHPQDHSLHGALYSAEWCKKWEFFVQGDDDGWVSIAKSTG